MTLNRLDLSLGCRNEILTSKISSRDNSTDCSCCSYGARARPGDHEDVEVDPELKREQVIFRLNLWSLNDNNSMN